MTIPAFTRSASKPRPRSRTATPWVPVLIELGYAPVFRYEKFRTEFHDGDGALVLDETPIGDFAELEGTPGWIDRALERLNIQREWCFTDSYGRMFLDWKARSGSPAENMTFEEIAPAAAR